MHGFQIVTFTIENPPYEVSKNKRRHGNWMIMLLLIF